MTRNLVTWGNNRKHSNNEPVTNKKKRPPLNWRQYPRQHPRPRTYKTDWKTCISIMAVTSEERCNGNWSRAWGTEPKNINFLCCPISKIFAGQIAGAKRASTQTGRSVGWPICCGPIVKSLPILSLLFPHHFNVAHVGPLHFFFFFLPLPGD